MILFLFIHNPSYAQHYIETNHNQDDISNCLLPVGASYKYNSGMGVNKIIP